MLKMIDRYLNYNASNIFQLKGMKADTIILVCTLSLVVSGLHVKYHESPESYLSTLKSQQSGITQQVATIKSDLSQVQQQVSSEIDLLKKIKLLQDAILRQKAKLNVLSKSVSVPLNESLWTCQSYVSTSKTQLLGLSSAIVASAGQLDSAVSSLGNKTSIPYFSPDSSAAATTAQDIQKAILSTGAQSTTLSSKNQTNWLANNWITGNKTLQQIQQQVQTSDQSTGYTVTCPLEAPYFDGTNCLGCPAAGTYFNMETKKCVACQNFDVSTHTCKDAPPTPPITPPIVTPIAPVVSNFTSGLNRTIFAPNTNVQALQNQTGQACPADRPFFTSSGCINCEIPTPLFNYTSQQCATCPSGFTFVQDKHTCVGPRQVFATNLPTASSQLILPDGTTITDLQNQQQELSKTATVVSCPAATPFFNNSTCINCDPNQFFEVSKLACVSCPSGTRYNETAHKCITTTFYSNLLNRNWTSTNPENVKAAAQAANGTIGSVPCPVETPFYDGTKCISCQVNQYFNFDGLKCEQCAAGTVFNQNQHSCVRPEVGVYQTNPSTAPNLIYDGTSKGEWWTIYLKNQQDNPQLSDCPVDRPYFDGVRCINCPAQYPQFNLREKICQACSQGSTYDSAFHECLSSSGDIISQKPNIQKMVASIFT